MQHHDSAGVSAKGPRALEGYVRQGSLAFYFLADGDVRMKLQLTTPVLL